MFREKGKWSSEGGARLGYSFVLVVLAAGVFAADIFIIYTANRDPQRARKVIIFLADLAAFTILPHLSKLD